jgi:hypothetical protein
METPRRLTRATLCGVWCLQLQNLLALWLSIDSSVAQWLLAVSGRGPGPGPSNLSSGPSRAHITAARLPNDSTTQRAQEGPARRKALGELEANPQLNCYRWY